MAARCFWISAAARRAVAEMSRSLTGIVKAGYSPHEQYFSDSRQQGPWSDIYALGATLDQELGGLSSGGSHPARRPRSQATGGCNSKEHLSAGLSCWHRCLP